MKKFTKNKESNIVLNLILILSIGAFFISAILNMISTMFILGIISWGILIIFMTVKKRPTQILVNEQEIIMRSNKKLIEKFKLSDLEYYDSRDKILTLKKRKSNKFLFLIDKRKWPSELFVFIQNNVNLVEQKEEKRTRLFLLQAFLDSV